MDDIKINIPRFNSIEEIRDLYTIITHIFKDLEISSYSVMSLVGRDVCDTYEEFILQIRNSGIDDFLLTISGYKPSFKSVIGTDSGLSVTIRNSSFTGQGVSCRSKNKVLLLKFIDILEAKTEVPEQDVTPSIPKKITNTTAQTKKYDVFVSHASTDKPTFVDKLVAELRMVTKDVWYDQNMISWGESLKSKIFEGLEKCEFGIVVFSQSFIGREWTEQELKQLLVKQNDNQKKVILPILLSDLTPEEFFKAYPSLKDTLFIKQQDHAVKDIAIMFAERLIDRLKAKR